MIDPEKCTRAFGKLSIVQQLSLVLRIELDAFPDYQGDEHIFQRALIVLQTIACHELGAETIVSNENLVRILNLLVKDGIFVENVAKVWSQMASNYFS